MTRISTPLFAIIAAVVVILSLAVMGAVVGLEIANRPVSTVVELYGGLTVTTIPSLLALVIAKDTNYVVKNGLKNDIIQGVGVEAAKVASNLANGVAPIVTDTPIAPDKEHPYA